MVTQALNAATYIPLSAGMILGQYEIRSRLGAGRMCEVCRAHDTRLHRDVALEVLPEYLTCDPELQIHGFTGQGDGGMT